tara:strand:- start:149 stop:1435 length:1287 start_codon:yes stop_codon:yes gene_type:complete
MERLSAWDISSKGLIFSKVFDSTEYDLELQKKAIANILYTQDFDLMPIVEKSASSPGSKTITGPITGVAILNADADSVELVDVQECPYVTKGTHFIPAIINLLTNQNRFVFVGESSEKAESIITSSMLISNEIKDRLVLLSAEAAKKGRINEDATYGLRVFEQLLAVIKDGEDSKSCLDMLKSLDPKSRVAESENTQLTYVPKGEITAQHIMKFPLAGVTKKADAETLLAAKILGEANDFTNILLYEKNRKIPDKVTMLNHENGNRVMCRTISYNMSLKSIIKSINPSMKICIVKPNPKLTIRGEKMTWPAIIHADDELQSDPSLKELGKYCVEVEVAVKNQNNISDKDKKKTLGSFMPHHKTKSKKGPKKQNSHMTKSLFGGTKSLKGARDALFHRVLGGKGKLDLKQMQEVVKVHDSFKPLIKNLK